MKLDLKQVIIDLEHVAIRQIDIESEGFRNGYLSCIDSLKNHPMIKEVTAPKVYPKREAEEKKNVKPRGGKTCFHCKLDGFEWFNQGDEDKPQWRLKDIDTGEIHSCLSKQGEQNGDI